MTSKKLVEDFLSQKNIAVVGASGNRKKFGYIIYKELKPKDIMFIL
jgi:predicted CoA-binding protein